MSAATASSSSSAAGGGAAPAPKPKAGASSDYVFVIDDRALHSGTVDSFESVCLPHPKYELLTRYLLIRDSVCEIQSVKEAPASWFVADSVVADGSLYVCTRVDPLFFAIQPLTKARNRTSDKPDGMFCQLSQIFAPPTPNANPNFGSPAQSSPAAGGGAAASANASPAPGSSSSSSSGAGSAASSLVSPSTAVVLPRLLTAGGNPDANPLSLICDVRTVGEFVVYRLNDSKLRAWLCAKVDRTCQAIMQTPSMCPISATAAAATPTPATNTAAGAGASSIAAAAAAASGVIPPNIVKTALGLVCEYLSPESMNLVLESFGYSAGDIYERAKVRKSAYDEPVATRVTHDADMTSGKGTKLQKTASDPKGKGKSTSATRAVAKLAKVDTKGMKSLSAFFGSKPATPAAAAKK